MGWEWRGCTRACPWACRKSHCAERLCPSGSCSMLRWARAPLYTARQNPKIFLQGKTSVIPIKTGSGEFTLLPKHVKYKLRLCFHFPLSPFLSPSWRQGEKESETVFLVQRWSQNEVNPHQPENHLLSLAVTEKRVIGSWYSDLDFCNLKAETFLLLVERVTKISQFSCAASVWMLSFSWCVSFWFC